MSRECKIHGLVKHYRRKPSGWRCSECSKESVNTRRRKVKLQLIEEFGGKCAGHECGYSKYAGALEFHHIDPSHKSFQISSSSISIRRLRAECNKCILLCANCHREAEGGLFDWQNVLPTQVCIECGWRRVYMNGSVCVNADCSLGGVWQIHGKFIEG